MFLYFHQNATKQFQDVQQQTPQRLQKAPAISSDRNISWQNLYGHFRNLNWRYLPYIRPIQALCKGISPQNMARNMVQYLHFWILKFPWNLYGLPCFSPPEIPHPSPPVHRFEATPACRSASSAASWAWPTSRGVWFFAAWKITMFDM